MKKVLIIDDDDLFSNSVRGVLSGSFRVVQASTAPEGMLKSFQEAPDLILLDLYLPGGSGIDVCRRLKSLPKTEMIPIIFITGESGLEGRIKALESGADDCLSKPFAPAELMARIKARLRSRETEDRVLPIEVGNLRVEPDGLVASVGGAPVNLTPSEYRILEYLARRKEKTVPRSKLLSDLWPDSVVGPRTVDAHIVRLRRKIRGFTGSIDTVYGGGYRLSEGQPAASAIA